MKYADYPARARTTVRDDLKARDAWAQTDCRNEHPRNLNTSSAMYGLTSDRFDGLAVRTVKGNHQRKAREARWVEASFRYEGLAVRQSGRNKRVDPDAGASRLERDMVDAAVRSGGTDRTIETSPRDSAYTGEGTTYGHPMADEMGVTRKAPGAKRAKKIGELGARQVRH